jgi:hypothetical protein
MESKLTDLEIAIKEAAEIYWKMQYLMALDESTKPYIIQDFTAGAKSDAAKDYWYKKFWEDYESRFKNQNNEI